MLFKDIQGQEEIKQKLIDAVQHNHVAHAQLFLGQDGSPNLPLALAYATYLNCENPGPDDACGQCAACVKNLKYIHPDTHFVFPVSSTKKVTGKDVVSQSFLADWRSFLLQHPFGDLNDWVIHFEGEGKEVNISKEESRQIIQALALMAFEGQYKVMIIWLPEYMHPFAANAILKILEEPPKKTIFLLVSNQRERLLSTILSRTQIVQVRPFLDGELQEMLVSLESVDAVKAAEVSRLAEGSFSTARRLLQNVEDSNQTMFQDWMRECYTRDYTKLVQRAEQFQKLNKVAQKGFLQYGLHLLRETLIRTAQVNDLQKTSEHEMKFVQNFGATMTPEKVQIMSSRIDSSYYHLERYANPKITFLDLSLTLSKIIR